MPLTKEKTSVVGMICKRYYIYQTLQDYSLFIKLIPYKLPS